MLFRSAQTFSVSVRLGSITGTVIATSSIVTINDTSTSPPTYSFTSQATTINEGVSQTFNIETTDVSSGTVLYWKITHLTTSADDFLATSGSFTVTNGAGSFTVTTTADAVTEGTQGFAITVRTGSTNGPVVVTSSTISIADTSLNPTYTFSTAPESIDEGNSGNFVITTTDVVNEIGRAHV